MYQSVIRDPGGSELIRIVPDLCGQNAAVVDGSILIVPAGTVAFVVRNGALSRSLPPGRYILRTGVDPFFVRMRNAMTRGDAAISLSVFYLSTGKVQPMRFGTGEVSFRERRFNQTLSALASGMVTFTIREPKTTLEQLVGSYSSTFTQEDVEPWLQQLIISPVRQVLADTLDACEIVQFNAHLTDIARAARTSVEDTLTSYGLGLVNFSITGVNVPEAELQRLHSLEGRYATGKIDTDLEVDRLYRIYGGDLDRRTFSELLTGRSSGGAPGQGGGCGDGMASSMMQMMILSQLLPSLREPLANMTRHTDLFGQRQSPAPHENTSSPDPNSPPPIPRPTRRCPTCNGTLPPGAAICPICGQQL